jgi:hypothetical protein
MSLLIRRATGPPKEPGRSNRSPSDNDEGIVPDRYDGPHEHRWARVAPGFHVCAVCAVVADWKAWTA